MARPGRCAILSSSSSLSLGPQAHGYGSRELNAAVADAVLPSTRWAVDLDSPMIELFLVVQDAAWSVGLLLPPGYGDPRRADSMP